MKKAILCLLLLILTPVVLAKSIDIELGEGESYFFQGRNVTLLKLNRQGKSVLVCVNGKEEIVSDHKSIGGLSIDLDWVKEYQARLELRASDVSDPKGYDNLDCFDECNIDRDCDDFDKLTEDRCDGRPKKCVYREIKKEEKIEDESLEENKSEEISEEISSDIEEEKKEFKSFTQWLFELILGVFKKQ